MEAHTHEQLTTSMCDPWRVEIFGKSLYRSGLQRLYQTILASNSKTCIPHLCWGFPCGTPIEICSQFGEIIYTDTSWTYFNEMPRRCLKIGQFLHQHGFGFDPLSLPRFERSTDITQIHGTSSFQAPNPKPWQLKFVNSQVSILVFSEAISPSRWRYSLRLTNTPRGIDNKKTICLCSTLVGVCEVSNPSTSVHTMNLTSPTSIRWKGKESLGHCQRDMLSFQSTGVYSTSPPNYAQTAGWKKTHHVKLSFASYYSNRKCSRRSMVQQL